MSQNVAIKTLISTQKCRWRQYTPPPPPHSVAPYTHLQAYIFSSEKRRPFLGTAFFIQIKQERSI